MATYGLPRIVGHHSSGRSGADEWLHTTGASGGGLQYGGLGSIGCVGLPSDLVREQVTTLRQATDRPFNLNFFAQMRPRTNPQATARVRAKLAPYFDEFGLGPVPEPNVPFPTFDEERLDLVLELRPRVVSFHFGLPETSAVRRLKQAGCIILSSATTVAEARSLESNGADVIIAQGFDAGGHRGSFSGRPGLAWSARWRWCPKSSMQYAYR